MTKERRPGPSVRSRVVELNGEDRLAREDRLATEEPLEIRLSWPGGSSTLGVTMRTPGHDFELAVGWALHEQILRREDLAAVRYCTDESLNPEQEFNVVTVETVGAPRRLPEARWISSACGVCGTDSIAEVLRDLPVADRADGVRWELVRELPARMAEHQPGFARTGGVHAAALVEADGTLVVVREDVGRHNAVDKVVGSRALTDAPVPGTLVLSGRVGFELVQKAAVSGIGTLVAVGAPTSLAVELAVSASITLVGFTRQDRCVIYAGGERFGV